MFRSLTREAEAWLYTAGAVLVVLIVLYSLLKAAARYAPSPIASLARTAADAAGLDEVFDPVF
jgi:hypothetical protein